MLCGGCLKLLCGKLWEAGSKSQGKRNLRNFPEKDIWHIKKMAFLF
jgi:hypothetical protein